MLLCVSLLCFVVVDLDLGLRLLGCLVWRFGLVICACCFGFVVWIYLGLIDLRLMVFMLVTLCSLCCFNRLRLLRLFVGVLFAGCGWVVFLCAGLCFL